VKRVFKYLKHSQELIIRYKPKKSDLIGYSDADFAVDAKDR
jgi:hypothetical protein